jgi:hypothetical protein
MCILAVWIINLDQVWITLDQQFERITGRAAVRITTQILSFRPIIISLLSASANKSAP